MKIRFLLYLLRWQLSGLILYPVLLITLPHTNVAISTIIANLLGGCLFFWIDLLLLTKGKSNEKRIIKTKKYHS